MAELIVIGSGTGIPSLKRASPCLLLVSKNFRILIDSGPGALRRLLEAGVTYQDIDLILYTHLHPDHTADLVPILFACKYGDAPREKPLTLIGGPGFQQFFSRLNDLYGPWINPQTYRLKVREVSSTPLALGGMRILNAAMAHLPESTGYRFEWDDGKVLVISGDTDYCDNLVRLASKADLLVLECSFPDEKKVNGHLTPSLAGRIARESDARRLLLTHLYPLCDQYDILTPCQREFSGVVLLAEDLQRLAL